MGATGRPQGDQETHRQLPPKIPKAEDVAVVMNQERTYLQSSQLEIWQGGVNLAPFYGEGVKVTVVASFGGDKTSY